jgi:hypothetical protein
MQFESKLPEKQCQDIDILPQSLFVRRLVVKYRIGFDTFDYAWHKQELIKVRVNLY